MALHALSSCCRCCCSSRLGVSVPLSDQFLHKYWPAGSPWKAEPIIKRTKPLALYYCPVPKCPRNFGDRALFLQHLRCGHNKFDLERLGVPSISGVQWAGASRSVLVGPRLVGLLAARRHRAAACITTRPSSSGRRCADRLRPWLVSCVCLCGGAGWCPPWTPRPGQASLSAATPLTRGLASTAPAAEPTRPFP